MTRVRAVVALLAAVAALQGCIASSVVLHVAPDGRGRAVITARIYEPALHAFDSMFSDSPKQAKSDQQLPPPGRGEMTKQFGAQVKLVSTTLDKTRRAMVPGSMQEVLWQLGDMPGAVVPRDHEVFLEFEPPQGAPLPPPATPPAAVPQGPPDTEIYLAPLKITEGTIEIGAATNITNNPGYDNQPFFTPDGRAMLFTSIRGGTQTDIYRYELPGTPSEGLAAGRVLQVTNTPESEYSPTITPSGALSVIRVELDGNSTQRLWQFTADGREPRVVLDNVKPVGYHAWADEHTLALFVLGQPATLQLADTRTGTARTMASEIGRSIHRMPGSGAARDISFVQRERVVGVSTKWRVKRLNPAAGEVTALAPALDGGTDPDVAWTPDGTLLTARNGMLLGWKPGQSGWKEITSLERLSLAGVTRLAVSPKGDFIALVGSPRQPR